MRRLAVLTVLASLNAGGCASGGRTQGNVDQLKRQLEEMAQAQAKAERRNEELSNQVALLEDKVDTCRVALESSGTPPRLPVIRLQPPAPEAEPRAPEPAAEDASGEAREEQPASAEEESDAVLAQPGRSVVEDNQVTLKGEARKRGPRPVLRLYGDSSKADSTVAAPLPEANPEAVTEKLDVVPLPGREVARRLAASSGATVSGATVRESGATVKEYEAALAMYQARKYAAAAEAFRAFVSKHATHTYADNALYWLGECLYDLQNYRSALQVFRRVVEEYPTGNKAPDALLKMGYCYLKLKDTNNAKTVLGQLVESFPKSQVAVLASKALVSIQKLQ